MEDILRRGQESGEFGEFTVRTMALSLITHFDRACQVKKPRRRTSGN